MTREAAKVDYGPVIITGGRYKGRIGCYDNDEPFSDSEKAVVYFGNMLIRSDYVFIEYSRLRFPTNFDLLKRRNGIFQKIGSFSNFKSDLTKRLDLLYEFSYIENELSGRIYIGKYGSIGDNTGKAIFISYSSKDKSFVRMLSDELMTIGHSVWFDEWKIRAGENIVQKVSEGISSADYVLVILSEFSVKSGWVEKEWQTKYWDEIQENKVYVIPVLYKECLIPPLLKLKKYADFSKDYNDGLEDLLYAINSLRRK